MVSYLPTTRMVFGVRTTRAKPSHGWCGWFSELV